jgi:hypothetical protein
MINPKMALLPSAYKSGKVYSALPSDGSGDFYFNRNTEASRVNQHGLVEFVGSNIPRLDYTGSLCPFLLLEGKSTNIVLNSSLFNSTSWNKVNTTVDENIEVSPSGLLDADKIARSSSSASYIKQGCTKSSASAIDVSASVFVKKGNSNFFAMKVEGVNPNRADLIYNFETGGLTSSVGNGVLFIKEYSAEDYIDGWVRLSMTVNTDTSSSVALSLAAKSEESFTDDSDASNSAFVFVWGAQMEESISKTSYIETTNTSVTREGDRCVGSGNSTLFNITEGTLYASVTPLSSSSDSYITLSNGSTNEQVSFIFDSGNYSVNVVVKSGGVDSVNKSLDISLSYKNKLAVSFAYDEFKIYLNGSLIHEDLSGSTPNGLSTLNFSNTSASTYFLKSKVFGARVYDKALTDEELTKLTKI